MMKMNTYSTAVVSQALLFMGYGTVSARLFLLNSMMQDRVCVVEDAVAAGFNIKRAVELAELTRGINTNHLENPDVNN